ncbi:MAG TPA: hypothetical protein VF730_15025 [Terracidiphilus sp.]
MKATVLYRIASVLLILFAAANTAWLVYFWRVASSLPPVPFPVAHHRESTYPHLVLVLEIALSLCVLFAAYLNWYLGTLARTAPHAMRGLPWLLLAYQAAGALVALFSLSGPAFLLAAACAVCTAWATSLVPGSLGIPEIAR